MVIAELDSHRWTSDRLGETRRRATVRRADAPIAAAEAARAGSGWRPPTGWRAYAEWQ